MTGIAWVELCAGTGAVAHRLVGGADHDSAVTYQGGKRRYATAILSALGLRPGQGAARLVLNDPGTWGRAWQTLVEPAAVREAISTIRQWARDGVEGRALFDRVEDAGQPAGGGPWLAAFLALQDGAFGGKPVMALSSGAWSTPGYARSARQIEGDGTNEPRHFK